MIQNISAFHWFLKHSKCFYKPLISLIIKVWTSKKLNIEWNKSIVCLTWSKLLARHYHFCICFFLHLNPFRFTLKPHMMPTLGGKKKKGQSTHFWWSVVLLQSALHCVLYIVRKYIVLYGGKSMKGNMCDSQTTDTVFLWYFVSCLVELCSFVYNVSWMYAWRPYMMDVHMSETKN